jgi:hypothetical protein
LEQSPASREVVDKGGLAARPRVYVAVLVAAIAAAFAVHMARESIFACSPEGYEGGYFLGYCAASDYGGFDHAAYWYPLEVGASRNASAADVLFIGNSRLQFGLSGTSLESWFREQGLSYYFLGFGYDENMNFYGPLLKRLEPRARAYVINADDFFVELESVPAQEVMYDVSARGRMLLKQAWQLPHRALCAPLRRLCGNATSFYRRHETGEWRHAGETAAFNYPTRDRPVDEAQVSVEIPRAETFIASLPVDHRCVFLTYIWTPFNGRASAAALADALGMELISPELSGLHTIDNSHLDPPSAERFSAAFIASAGPRLLSCLDGDGPLSARHSSSID